MRLMRSGCTGKTAVVEEGLQLDQCSVSHDRQPNKVPQRSIGLFAMRHGEGALYHAMFGARGITSYRVQRSPPLILYPSIHALEVSQALEDDMVRLHGRCTAANSDSDVSIFGS